ncbi:DUF5959 family protein [Streptomyces xanthii]|uniref:Uncharacterized protein n=1 Tax=Streptomyces xanthii TaxID=2768069 RepID=A0A7H1B0J8_9ACTN|nr:DUF5959 family protein [Streptomyces xanthii]QNS02253.1 hypothetical protein IAG42_00610 [Streptomyces xanthii]
MANLADLRDAENSFRIEVSGRFRPGVLQDHDTLAAEIVVVSSFVSGRLRVWIRPAELQAWQGVLSVLREGKPATWLDQGNGPVVAFDFPDGLDGDTVITVEDATGSGAVATLPLGLEGAWVDEQIALLDAVRKQWPSEVLESSYGVFEWKKS